MKYLGQTTFNMKMETEQIGNLSLVKYTVVGEIRHKIFDFYTKLCCNS